MSQSSIEWTEMTWNPTTGCDKISAGCKYCYAEIMTRRLMAMGIDKYKDGFKVRTHEDALHTPFEWKKPRVVFVNSMSDLFHPKVPIDFIKKVFYVMNQTPQHTYQVLTKRADRLFEIHKQLNWTKNIWMGVSVEDSRVTNRIDYLRKTNAATKFLYCEPLIGALPNMNLTDIDWIIVGGESGRMARPMYESWIWDIKQQCAEQGAALFFKQWGGKNKKKAGRQLGGRTYDAMPEQKLLTDNVNKL